MIVDTSAVIAAADDEPSAAAVVQAVKESDSLSMSAATAVELTAVLMRYELPGIHRQVDAMLDAWGVQIVPFDEEQSRIARQAYRDYGRGSGHPAGLNLGDCYAYALAQARREPLLFVGDDFIHTDVTPRCPDDQAPAAARASA